MCLNILVTLLLLSIIDHLVFKGENHLAQGANKFIREVVGIDGAVIRVENGHYTSMVCGFCSSPEFFIILANTVCQRRFIFLYLMSNY